MTSGTGYTILATLVTLYGEDGAFDYLKRLAPERRALHAVGHRAGTVGRARRSRRRRDASCTSSSRSSSRASRSTSRSRAKAPATRSAAWPSSPARRIPTRRARSTTGRSREAAQELANRTRNLIMPANAAADVRPEAARFANAATLDVDPAKFGAARRAQAAARALAARDRRRARDGANAMNEFELIERYFRAPARDPSVRLGIGDDAARGRAAAGLRARALRRHAGRRPALPRRTSIRKRSATRRSR